MNEIHLEKIMPDFLSYLYLWGLMDFYFSFKIRKSNDSGPAGAGQENTR